jgi:hypothetical protein
MLIPHVVQTEADKVFINILNNQTVALSAGDFVAWNVTSPDGVRTTQIVSATLSLVTGVADSAIAASGYGLAQVYGYNSAALCINNKTTSFTLGDTLIAITGQDYVGYGKTPAGYDGFVFAAQTFVTDSTPAAATKKVFLKLM